MNRKNIKRAAWLSLIGGLAFSAVAIPLAVTEKNGETVEAAYVDGEYDNPKKVVTKKLYTFSDYRPDAYSVESFYYFKPNMKRNVEYQLIVTNNSTEKLDLRVASDNEEWNRRVDISGEVYANEKGYTTDCFALSGGDRCFIRFYADNSFNYRFFIKEVTFPRVKKADGVWTYFNKDRVPDSSFTGVAQSTTGNWVFIRKGKYYSGYTGVAKSVTGNWVYVKKGRYYTGATGVARSTTGNYVYVKNGRFNSKFTGLARSLTTNRLVYVKNGKWQKTYNGTAQYNGRTYTVKNGIVK